MFSVVSSAVAGTKIQTDFTIKDIETAWGKNGYVIRVNEVASQNPLGCNQTGFRLKTEDNSMHNEILSIALSAMHTGSRVRFYVEDSCRENRHMIIAIQIVK